MIHSIDTYRELINKFLTVTPMIKKDLLFVALNNNFRNDYRINESFANSIITAMQCAGEIFISDDGWVMTKGAYVQVTNDRYYENVNWHHEYRVFGIDKYCSKKYSDICSCLYILADLLPDADDFCEMNFPFNLAFVTKESETQPSLCYEVCYIPKAKQDAMRYVFLDMPRIKDEDYKRHILRIAIVENEDMVKKVPYCGFKFICIMNDKSSSRYSVIEKRKTSEMWRDYV